MHAIIRSSSIWSLSSHSRSCMMFSSSCWKSVMACNAFLLKNILKVSFKKFRKKSMHWLRALWKTWLKRYSTSFPLQYSWMSDRKVYQPIPWAVIFELIGSDWLVQRHDQSTDFRLTCRLKYFCGSRRWKPAFEKSQAHEGVLFLSNQTSGQKFVFSSLRQL